jgi:Peptidase A4 family
MILVALLLALLSPIGGHQEDANWSGYALTGGPFTSISGTFTVASPMPGPQCSDQMAEWVGIDGFANSDLIQAGIDETAPCDGDAVSIQAWWEILPGAEQPITSMNVSVGDVMEVIITNTSGHTWLITVDDQTTGVYWHNTFQYNAPLASAEWIVEAPTQFMGITTIMPYTPVAFTHLSVTGPVKAKDAMWLKESGLRLSIPSWVPSIPYLLAKGFEMEYTGG